MQQVTQPAKSTDPRAGPDTGTWLPLLDGTEPLGVLGVTLPGSALDEPAQRRLQRFASAVTEVVITETFYGDNLVRGRRTNPTTLAAEIR